MNNEKPRCWEAPRRTVHQGAPAPIAKPRAKPKGKRAPVGRNNRRALDESSGRQIGGVGARKLCINLS